MLDKFTYLSFRLHTFSPVDFNVTVGLTSAKITPRTTHLIDTGIKPSMRSGRYDMCYYPCSMLTQFWSLVSGRPGLGRIIVKASLYVCDCLLQLFQENMRTYPSSVVKFGLNQTYKTCDLMLLYWFLGTVGVAKCMNLIFDTSHGASEYLMSHSSKITRTALCK